MDPFSALIGGGTSLIGGLMGADAQQEAADNNYKINLMNYYARNQERNDRINAAADAQMRQDTGGTDANGNRTYWDPLKGWTVNLSADQKGIQNAQNAEQTARLGIDLPMRREQMLKNLSDQGDNRFIAENLLKHFGMNPDTATDEAAKLKTAMGTGINQNYDQAMHTAAHDQLTQNSSNYGNVLRQLTQGRSNDMAKAFASVPMQADALARGHNAQDQSQQANLISYFSGKASQMPQVQYSPQDTTSQANSLLNADASRGASADNNFATAMGQKGGTLDYMEPNMGYGNAIASAGNVFSSGLGKMNAMNQYNDMYADIKRRTGGNSGTGIDS